MTTAIIIQARMGSARFPGKALAFLDGLPVVGHVILAALRAQVGEIILAVPFGKCDDPLAEHANAWKGAVTVIRGSEQNVLRRFAHANTIIKADHIVRLTGDCPLVDPAKIRSVVDRYSSYMGSVPYLGQTNWPDGNDVEVFSGAALAEAAYTATANYDKEHVTPYMQRMIGAVLLNGPADAADDNYDDVHYSVNTRADLDTCASLLKANGYFAPCHKHIATYRALKGTK